MKTPLPHTPALPRYGDLIDVRLTELDESIGKTKHRRRVRKAHNRTHWAARTPGDAPFEGLYAVDGALSRRPWSLFGRSVMQ